MFALGDFNSRVGQVKGLEGNTPDTNMNTPMFLDFTQQVNLLIVNTLPIARGLFTRFMDNSGRPRSQSLLDYGLIDDEHANNVTSFVIDEDARFGCLRPLITHSNIYSSRYDYGSDHALLECTLQFGDRPKVKILV